MTLVRGSTDRIRLEWEHDHATGPDGYRYAIQTERVRGEGTAYYSLTPSSHDIEVAERVHGSCPYGYTGTLADARRVCEWFAWTRSKS